jgi:molybdate transport system substrate-binding protein
VRHKWIRAAATAVAAAVALAVGACGSDEPSSSGPGSTSAGVTGNITVFAAASLTDSFTQIGKDFEAANPGTKVVFNFAASSALATQINEGAPADVFASASPATMKTVTDAGNADGTPSVFVRNQLVVAVAKGNPKGIAGLADLSKADVKVALCAEQVPCGAASKKALDAAGVSVTPVTFEQDVRATLSKLTLGEVDAAMVYRTDVKVAAADVEGIEIPESASAINDYPIAVLKDAPNKAGAQAFLTYVQSDPAQAVLTQAGFQAP